jgi:methionyl-tRNA formyltransferase
MKLIFMGTPSFAVPSLQKLLEAGHAVAAVFTQPDKPVGRKQIITPPPVKVFAQSHNLTILQPTKIKTPEARAEIEPLLKAADAGIVAAYGRLLPGWMLSAPKQGCINVHSSLLPKYRGAAPINWAIASGERETGVTIMQMDEGLDTGPMLLQGRLAIGENETAPELTARLADLGASLLLETLTKLESGTITATPQNNDEATYAPILKKEDGQVDWSSDATKIRNRLRGFTPFPGCFTFLNGQRIELIKVTAEAPSSPDAENAEDAEEAEEAEPGAIVEVMKDSFVVACGDASRLRVTQVQPAGKKVMSVRDFLNGAKIQPGAKLTGAALP